MTQLLWMYKRMRTSLVTILGIVLSSLSIQASAADEGLFYAASQHDWWTGYSIHPFWFVLFIAVMMWVVALGVGLFYHRVLSHRVFKPNRFLAYFFVTAAAPAGTPVQWVGNHRHHHVVADTEDDPHSPSDKGFWVAHAGWYIYTHNKLLCILYSIAGPLRMVFDAFWRPRTNLEHVHRAKDIAADPYYAWLSRPGPYAFVVLSHVLLTWLFVFWLWGLAGCLILYVVQVSYYVIGDTVNSTMHMHGNRPFDSGDKSTNNPWLVFLTSGEAYHNTHHAFPSAVNLGILPKQFDLNYFWSRVFEKLGLATDLRHPPKSLILSKLKEPKYRQYIEDTYPDTPAKSSAQ